MLFNSALASFHVIFISWSSGAYKAVKCQAGFLSQKELNLNLGCDLTGFCDLGQVAQTL